MVDQEQVLRSFLELLSGETIFPTVTDGSEKQRNSHENTDDVLPNRQKTASFLKEHTNSQGTKLSIPSLSSSKNLEGSLSEKNDASVTATGAEEALPNSVIRAILKRGNPFPPKTSFAKGKKKLQKRRSTKQSEALASISAAAAIVAAEDESNSVKSSSGAVPEKTKAQEMQDKIGRTITYASSCANSTGDSTAYDNNNGEAGDADGKNIELSKALDTLHFNLNGTVQALLQSQLISLLSVLVYKSIKSNGRVSDGASKILASLLDGECFSEEDDHEAVLRSLENCRISSNGNGDGSDPQVKQKKNENSMNGDTSTLKDADVSMTDTDTDPFDHVSKITSIHTKPLSDHMAECEVEMGIRHPKTSVDKCTTSFSLSPTGMEKNEEGDESSGKTKKCALLFGAEVHIAVMESKAIIEFGTSGTIEGDFDDSKLRNASISLDIKGLFQSIVREINKSLKTVMYEKKPTAAPVPKKNRLARREAHLRAAQTLSELEAGGKRSALVPGSSSIRPSSKRAREESISSAGMRSSPPKRMNNMDTSLGSMETAADMVRMATEGHAQGNMFQNQYNPSAVMSNGMGNSMGGMSNTSALLGTNPDNFSSDPAALANAVRKAEIDKVLSSVSAGNSGYGIMNSGAMNLARSGLDSHLTAAAEAVRLADHEKNFGGTGDSMALNPAIRRSSYGSTPMSAAAGAVRLSEMENALNATLRRGSRTGDSMAAVTEALRARNLASNTAAEAIRLVEMESAIRRGDPSVSAAVAAAEASRRTSFNGGRRTSYGANNLMSSAAAEVVRMAETESLMRGNGVRRSSFNTAPATDTADSMASALESVRMAEMESVMRRNSRADSLAAASEAIRLAEARTRRSSLTEAMRLVEMDALRRSSAGNSMAAAAEAVRLAEMDSFGMQRGLHSMMSPGNYGHQNRFYSSGECESVESLAALLQRRRSSGPAGSMLTAAEAVRVAEQERWSRHRRSSGPTGSMAASAAEVARLAEMDTDTHNQATRHVGSRIGMSQPSGRRVSFGPDTLYDQLSRFRRGN